MKPTNERAVCTAPAGGCGFRTRDWRRGQPIAGIDNDHVPRCFCGSEMRPLKK